MSLQTRRTPTRLAAFFALAAAAFGLSRASANDLSSLDAIAEEIQAALLAGPQSPDLLGPLTALSLGYFENGAYAQALTAIEQARMVVRANYGLHALEQAPLMQQRIRIEEERGNYRAAWDAEQDLLSLLERHPNDLRIAPILQELAAKRLEVLSDYIAGGFPPQLPLGCYYSGVHRWLNVGLERDPFPMSGPRSNLRDCYSGSRRMAIRAMEREAAHYAAVAQRVTLRHAFWTAGGTSTCRKPARPEFPEANLSRREERLLKDDVRQYLAGMFDYTSCLQANYDHMRAAASPAALAQVAEQNNEAIAELAQVRAAYQARFGPIGTLARWMPAFDRRIDVTAIGE